MGATVEIGMLSTPMMTMTNVTDIRLEGLAFDLGRFDGLALNQCCRVLIAGCTVSRMAGTGIVIHGGDKVGRLSCDIHTIGRRASEVIGGDRETLKPGRHCVENCSMHDFGRIDRTYTPAVHLEGVGNRIAHNLMYACPTSVMNISGNDHIIEFNDVRNVFCRSGGVEDMTHMDLAENANYGSRDPGFADAAHANWRLKPAAKPYADIGFRPIPMDAIGLYQDAYRAGLPADTSD